MIPWGFGQLKWETHDSLRIWATQVDRRNAGPLSMLTYLTFKASIDNFKLFLISWMNSILVLLETFAKIKISLFTILS